MQTITSVKGAVLLDTPFEVRVRKAREAAGLSRPDVTFQLRDYPPTMWASTEKLRRLETGEIAEDGLDPIFLAVLATIYECNVSDLSPGAVEGAARIRDLLEAGIRCPRAFADVA